MNSNSLSFLLPDAELFSAILDGHIDAIWIIDFASSQVRWLASPVNKKKYCIPDNPDLDFWRNNLHSKGEHGKGFAVVAAEVCKLTERSQKAAAEITEISSKTVRAAQQSKELLLNTLPDISKTAQLVQKNCCCQR